MKNHQVRLRREHIPMNQRVDDGEIFTNDFEAYWERNKFIFLKKKKYIESMRGEVLDEDDVKNTVYLLWLENKDNWDPERSAFHTYITNLYDYHLKKEWPGEVRSIQENGSEETQEEFLDRELAKQDNDSLWGEVDEEFEETIKIICKDKKFFHSFLKTLPAYQKRKYRVYIDRLQEYYNRDLGISTVELSLLVAEELGVCERRARQIQEELVRHLKMRKERMIEDNKLLARQEEHINVTFSFIPVKDFRLFDTFEENQICAMARAFYSTCNCPFPVTTDQYMRVLDSRSALIVHAARYLNIVAVPHVMHYIDGSKDEIDDPLFLRVRQQLSIAFDGKPRRKEKKTMRFSLLANC